MASLFLLFILATTLWMAMDSRAHKIPVDKKPYGLNNGALAWFLTGLLLWIITFPYYLWKRAMWMNQQREAISPRSVPPIASPHSDGLEKSAGNSDTRRR